MADIVDLANDHADELLSDALRKQKQVSIMTTQAATGHCFYCDEDVEKPRRWCGPECRDAWTKENA